MVDYNINKCRLHRKELNGTETKSGQMLKFIPGETEAQGKLVEVLEDTARRAAKPGNLEWCSSASAAH